MRNTAKAEGLDAVEGVTVEQLDIVDAESRAGAIARTLDRFGRIDVLVNNAGVSALGPCRGDPRTGRCATSSRPTSSVRSRSIREVLPSMRANHTGRIVNVTSIGAVMTSGFYSDYCATKHALDALSLGMDIELQQFGIRVATVVPGGFTTSMVANLIRTERSDTIYPRFATTLEEYKVRASGKADLSPVTDAIIAAATDPEPRRPLPGRHRFGRDVAHDRRRGRAGARLLPRPRGWLTTTARDAAACFNSNRDVDDRRHRTQRPRPRRAMGRWTRQRVSVALAARPRFGDAAPGHPAASTPHRRRRHLPARHGGPAPRRRRVHHVE